MTRGIVLAAGMGRRMGLPKALAPFRGESLHARALREFRSGGVEVIVVVNPAVASALPPVCDGESRILNDDPDSGGMFRSVQLAVEAALRDGAKRAVVVPVDHPLITSADIRAVVAEIATDDAIVVATHEGRRGHPVGFGESVMREIAGAPHTASLRDIVRRDPARVTLVEASPGAVLGANTKEELAALERRSSQVN